ncbi:MAG: TadE/TadG family type IV pilus assembly protein, partial [Candidatus Dormibacteraceae bacterium]
MAGPVRWRGRRGSGQSLVEFALVSPILLLLLVGILEAMLLLFGISTAHY